MWLTSGRASGRKTLLQYSSLTPLERYEGEVQPYRKTDYKPIIYEWGKGVTSEADKYLSRANNVWWRCVQYFVIASCG